MKSIIKQLTIFYLIFISISLNAADKFDYSIFDNLLKKYVIGTKVDYKGLIKEKDNLFKFTQLLAEKSPDSQPDLFPTSNDKLAYWINAYNAYILETIVKNYPVESIKDINFIGVTVWLNKNMLGGEEISFKSLEDDIIRERFNDPRIHFAINCASASCPPLINEAYLPEKLNEQLKKSTTDFINNPANLKIDENKKEIHISAIFDWYKDDFIGWLKTNHKEIKNPVVLDFIKIYYKNKFDSNWYDYKIDVFEYDWSLNE